MRPDSVREWLQYTSFRPFRLHLTNGITFEVRHPEHAIVGRDRVRLEVVGPSGAAPVRRIDVALLHITHIEQIAVTPPPSAN